MEKPVPVGTVPGVSTAQMSKAVEHAMCLCSDPALVAALKSTRSGSAQAAAIVGKITYQTQALLVSGEPLTCWVNGKEPESHWQGSPRAGSLLEQLHFLRVVHGSSESEDLLEEWLTLSERELPVTE